jgi:hypothetical protein
MVHICCAYGPIDEPPEHFETLNRRMTSWSRPYHDLQPHGYLFRRCPVTETHIMSEESQFHILVINWRFCDSIVTQSHHSTLLLYVWLPYLPEVEHPFRIVFGSLPASKVIVHRGHRCRLLPMHFCQIHSLVHPCCRQYLIHFPPPLVLILNLGLSMVLFDDPYPSWFPL